MNDDGSGACQALERYNILVPRLRLLPIPTGGLNYLLAAVEETAPTCKPQRAGEGYEEGHRQ